MAPTTIRGRDAPAVLNGILESRRVCRSRLGSALPGPLPHFPGRHLGSAATRTARDRHPGVRLPGSHHSCHHRRKRPVRHYNLGASLLQVALFMAVVAVTGLFLGAATAERNRAERRRSEDYARLRSSEERLARQAEELAAAIGAKTNSSPSWDTSCAIRSRPCKTVWSCSPWVPMTRPSSLIPAS